MTIDSARVRPGPGRPGWRVWNLIGLGGMFAYSTGVAWQAQQVSYPLFRAVPATEFAGYHLDYNSAIPLVVIAPGFLTFLAGTAFVWTRPAGTRPDLAVVVSASGLAALVSTVAWAIPMHNRLDRIGQDATTIDSLLRANAVRSVALTAGTLALGAILAQLVRGARDPRTRAAAHTRTSDTPTADSRTGDTPTADTRTGATRTAATSTADTRMANTRMMGIVHSALRRDLVRLRLVLQGAPDLDRREALADQVRWLMRFLHNHHAGEDDGLFPLVLACNPQARQLLEVMDADHERIGPAISALEAAALAYRDGQPGSGEVLLRALAAMSEVLLPHLEREELELMPVVSASITDEQWRAWDKEHNLDGKPMLQLAVEAGWVMDGLDPTARRHVERIVPPLPRFLLTRVLGGRYRRLRRRLWAGTPAADLPSLPLGHPAASTAE